MLRLFSPPSSSSASAGDRCSSGPRRRWHLSSPPSESSSSRFVLETRHRLIRQGSKPALYGAVVCVFLFNTAFALGWQASVWLYNAEVPAIASHAELTPQVPNTQTRTQVSALGACCNWALNSVIVLVADPYALARHPQLISQAHQQRRRLDVHSLCGLQRGDRADRVQGPPPMLGSDVTSAVLHRDQGPAARAGAWHVCDGLCASRNHARDVLRSYPAGSLKIRLRWI